MLRTWHSWLTQLVANTARRSSAADRNLGSATLATASTMSTGGLGTPPLCGITASESAASSSAGGLWASRSGLKVVSSCLACACETWLRRRSLWAPDAMVHRLVKSASLPRRRALSGS